MEVPPIDMARNKLLHAPDLETLRPGYPIEMPTFGSDARRRRQTATKQEKPTT
jgi:hypothetical protein